MLVWFIFGICFVISVLVLLINMFDGLFEVSLMIFFLVGELVVVDILVNFIVFELI